MIYEIINPSDPYTIDTDDREAACFACLVLGEGNYGLKPVPDDGESAMPIFIFGGADAWWQKEFGYHLAEAVERIGRERIAAVLESVLIGKPSDRELFADALAAIDDPVKRAAFRDKQHDRARSSMNNIGGRAYRIAENLRKPETAAS